MKTHNFNVDDLMVLPQGTPVWSIPLQENICINRECIVRIKHTTYTDNYVFCNVQLVLENQALAAAIDDDSDPRSYVDTKNEIGVAVDKLFPYVPPVNLFRGHMTAFYESIKKHSGTTDAQDAQ